MPTIEANGQRLHYLKEGQGPAILFIHSLGAAAEMWEKQFAHFSPRYTCIAFDCRGHGHSIPAGPFSVPHIAADLSQGLAALGIESCHVVGLSMGGPIALTLDEIAPGLARSLVIADSYFNVRAQIEVRMRQTHAALDGKTMREFGEGYAKSRLRPETPKPVYDALAGWVARLSKESYLEVARAIAEPDLSTHLEKIVVPTLVLYGDHESDPLKAQADQMVAEIADARLAVIANAGHLSNLDQPDAFNRTLAEFLDAQPR